MNPIELNFTVDLAKKETQVVRDLNSPLYYGDMNAHTLNITILRNGEPEDLSDVTPYGYIVFESTGDTVELADSSSKSGNVVSVTLSDEAYAVTGRAYIVVQLAKTGTRATVFAVYCWIGLGVTDSIIVPSGSRLDIDALTSKIAEFEQKISEVQNLVDDMEDAVASANDAVKYSSQTGKTDVEKARARENIGAVGTDEMSEEYLLRLLLGNDDDWSVNNYDSASYSATKKGRTITYKGNNNSNSGFQSVNLTGVPGAPHTVRSGNFNNITLADTDFVPIPAILKSISNQSADCPVMLFLSGQMHYDRYNDDGHAGFSFDYVLRRYNTETETYEYTPRTTTSLGLINTPTTANGVDRISIAQLIPDGRGGDYVVKWDEWEEMAIFATRRNRMFSGTMLLTPSLEIYGDQKPVVYSVEQNLSETEQKLARENIGAANEADERGRDGLITYRTAAFAMDEVPGATNATCIGAESTGEIVTLNGTNNASGGVYVRLTGPGTRTASATTVRGWTGALTIPSGTVCRLTMRLLSGSVDGAVAVSVYKSGTSSTIGNARGSNGLYERTWVSDGEPVSVAIWIASGTTLTNAVYSIIIEDITHGQFGLSIAVDGATPTITAAPGIRYECGTVNELTFTPSASGLCEVVFTTGSNPTEPVMPSTVRMPDWWTGVEANRTYDIMILNGTLAGVMSWAT